ncbi:MAG: phage portal protein, partial [Burkholderiaceae bacterium]
MVDGLVAAFFPQAGLNRARARALLSHVRAYEGASPSDGWRPRRAGASANTDHEGDGQSLRIRARALVQNVPYVSRAITMRAAYSVGTGITPRAVGAFALQRDELFERWAKTCDADGSGNWASICQLVYRARRVDGEVLIRRRRRRAIDGLAAPLQLQVLEIDWLDGDKNGQVTGSPSGHLTVNGIEYDTLGKPAAYWLYDKHPGELRTLSLSAYTSRRQPASDIIHLYSKDRPGQGRGFSALASVIARIRDVQLLEDAELTRKTLESKLGIIASGNTDGMGVSSGEAASVDAATGVQNLGSLGAGITVMPPGMNITAIEPQAAPGFTPYLKHHMH